MSMKATLLRDSLGNIIVQMEGGFDYASCEPLRKQLTEITTDHPEAKLQIDMSGVSFVGSSGINHFVDTLKLLHKSSQEPITLSNVDEDFKRVFELYGLTNAMVVINNFTLEINETEGMNQAFGNRKNTFQN